MSIINIMIVAIVSLVNLSRQCTSISPEGAENWTFHNNRILCHTTLPDMSFCDMYEKPQEVICERKKMKKTEIDSKEGILLHWNCISDKSYQFYVFCPIGLNLCNESMENCLVIYNPSSIVYDSLSKTLSLLLVIFIVFFIISVIYITRIQLELARKRY